MCRWLPGRTLIGRYARVLPPEGQDAAAAAADAVPPLDGGPDDHASEATHAVTLAQDGQTSRHRQAGAAAPQVEFQLRDDKPG
jgi:hypothetical protein